MAEIVILLAIKKIGTALANGVADQASTQFAKYGTQLLELQASMDRLVRELSVMHDVLCQMDIRNLNNTVYESWLEGVRKVAYNTEDMVDEYLYLVGQENDIGCCFYLKKGFRKPRSLLSLNRIAIKVKQIEEDLTHLSETKNRWVPVNNGDTSSSDYIVKRSQDLANISRSLAEDLVGVDENSETLQKWLAGDHLERSVIALLGMGGLGKTALAANVYRKEREKFQCHAWVSISQTYSREAVLRNIIKELSRGKVSVLSNTTDMDIPRLEETIKTFLEQQKYLIILDDVWTPEAFNDLSSVLIHNDMGSRLVITTRESRVAALASQGHILTLPALPEDKAWDLFCKKAFPRDTSHECPTELKHLSEEIVSKCKGLPLVIVLVGSLLRVREKTVEEWRRINAQLSWELINNSSLSDIRNVLHLSFIYLPTRLKCCFLYCSLFSEDYLFKRKQLVRLLVAEGFIEERGESTLEDVAEGYLKELIDRNMLQLVTRNHFGRMKEFRMHDILRELAVDLCQKNCFGVAYENKCGRSHQKDGRRLVLHKQKDDIQQPVSNMHHLRTIITLGDSKSSFTLLPLLCNESRYMTVLELSGLPIEKIPDAIGDLFNLRHLGLRGSKVKMLPKTIENLSNLLTLDLYESDIQELPSGIVKLKKLRHLFAQKTIDSDWRELASCSGVRIPNGLGNIINLQTLQALELQDESVRHLGELRQVRSLRLLNVKGIYCRSISESLVKMQYLSYLEVNASNENEVLLLNVLLPSLQRLCLRGRLAEGALDESPLFQAVEGQNLYVLYLSWSQLREDPLPSLSRLSNLTYLHFTRAYNGEQLAFLTGWFPKLKVLSLGDLLSLSRLEIQQGAMASLEELYLVNLGSMTEVPAGIEFLTSIKYLGFHEISRDFLTSLRQCSTIQGILSRAKYSLRD
ncbi:disease resistance protein RPM1-like [Triticum dicoccoides]|nr:disease resistance protein RPM1-like [Triticum dicoccoides]XP_037457157.1 disease resistance protein RPM1-like [Triticum dicoccoides]XP_037457158.1 disease resistance protein RPM1-like [Triticum dicoccoides]XP_037457159.1 disease resistance protein RPM1-like [Triticum dicoccoides]XP_037457160.1 disease resistance protein RPM1-like [Triticum dicoccoides]XP_037457161.1 disease resistance protein RPM1-like [Triticum dicoccoides]XP_037457162.1 disease resistance protein RPM1-like [Triticum dic